MNNLESRIRKLENREGAVIPEKLITLLSELEGFKLKHNLGPNPTREEVLAVICRMSNHSKK